MMDTSASSTRRRLAAQLALVTLASVFLFGDPLPWGMAGAPEPRPDSETAPHPVDLGRIAGTVIFDGEVPLSPIPDDAGLRRPLIEVDAASRGLRHVVVYLEPLDPAAKLLAGASPATEPRLIDQENYEFKPRLLAVRAGEAVAFRNSDAANHNVRAFTSVEVNQFNVFTGIDGKYEHRFASQPSGRPIALGCDIHPWMQGWIYVFEHSLFAVTNDKGRFEIRSVPAGRYRVLFRQPDIRFATERQVMLRPGESTTMNLSATAALKP